VEVRSKAEILSTLDREGTHGALPFMPEMFQYCGRRFQVHGRADKTCDTVNRTGGRQMRDTVHLQGLRCDGAAHGGCEAGCLLFWREAWLKRVDDQSAPPAARPGGCTEDDVNRAVWVDRDNEVYRCQATQLPVFTQPLKWYDVRQYWRDLTTNGLSFTRLVRVFSFTSYRALVDTGVGYRALIWLYNQVVPRFGGTRYPLSKGPCEKTPTALLDLKPGELVRIKTHEEILSTLDHDGFNRGLWFDCEMVKYCGQAYPVSRRVKQILNEKTGKMMRFSNPCIVLEDVHCRAETTKYRLFCPRSNLIYWREIWLEREGAKAES
jgi:hypothetical protein